MGRIGGDLEVLGMANLLQAITASQREGRLTVTRDDESKTIQCGPAGLRMLRGTRRVSPLGEILLRTRKITREQLTKILADQPKSGMQLGEYVTKRGILPQESIEKALREQAADEIYDLFTWTQGKFEYVDTEEGIEETGDGVLSSVLVDQSVMFIALEAARRMDHLARIREVIFGEKLVPVALEIPLAEHEPGLDRETLEEILPFVDGRRTVAQIIEESLFPKFTVLLTLYAMAQKGAAKIRDVGGANPETILLKKFSRLKNETSQDTATLILMGDRAPARLSLSLYLGNLGFTTVECSTSDDVAALQAKTSANVLILDLDIGPDKGLAQCVKQASESGLPMIVLTAFEERVVAHAFKCGARHVFLKPVDWELLIERLRATLITQGERTRPFPTE